MSDWQADPDGLLRDKGKIRDCASNRIEMGYWRSLWEFHSYKEILVLMFYMPTFLSGVVAIVSWVISFILIPLAPFIQCHFDMKNAKRHIEYQRECDEDI